jgi:hypothetical protein
MGTTHRANGRLIAETLSGSWRNEPASVSPSAFDDIQDAVRLFLRSGTGALCWWRMRNSGRALTPLKSVYVQYAAQAIRYEQEVAEICDLLASARIRSILIKGWAVARLYPDPGLRPSGDIDLLVSTADSDHARMALSSSSCAQFSIDLKHDEFARFGEMDFERLYDLSERVYIADSAIQILCPEDNLRLLCLHFLKHGGWRPLWLCDVAAALESMPRTFNWDRCLGTCKRHARWISCTIEAARQLLGARPVVEPPAEKRPLPGWLLPAILDEWNVCMTPVRPSFSRQLSEYGRSNPRALVREIRMRWPNPIQATIDTDVPFNWLPRMPFQLWRYLSRAARVLYILMRSKC